MWGTQLKKSLPPGRVSDEERERIVRDLAKQKTRLDHERKRSKVEAMLRRNEETVGCCALCVRDDRNLPVQRYRRQSSVTVVTVVTDADEEPTVYIDSLSGLVNVVTHDAARSLPGRVEVPS